MSKEKLNFYPCTCKLVCYYCKCLPEIERKNELKLFRYHNKHSCSLESHRKFEKNGYYLTRRPTWKNGFCSNVIKEKTVEKIEKCALVFGLRCTCTTHHYCNMCKTLLNECKMPYLKVSKREKIWVKMLEEIKCPDCSVVKEH